MNCLTDATGLNFATEWAGDDGRTGRRWRLKAVVAKTSSPVPVCQHILALNLRLISRGTPYSTLNHQCFLSSLSTKCSTLPLSSISLGQNVLRAVETRRVTTMGIEANRVRDNSEAPATSNSEGRKRYPEWKGRGENQIRVVSRDWGEMVFEGINGK